MRRALLLSAAFVAFAFGCSSASVEDDAAGSEAAHTEGEYVHFANHPFVWTKDVAHSEMTFAEEDLSKVVPDSDPLAKRLQAWADRIDDIVRAKVREGGEELVAPKPIIKVLPTGTLFNAWASGIPVCLGVPFAGHPEMTSETPDAPVVVGSGYMGQFPVLAPGEACRQKPTDWPLPERLTQLWSDLSPMCQLSYADGKFSSPNCMAPDGPDTMMVAVTPYIHFGSILLAAVDEMTAVGVLAHELGHYYRAHMSTLYDHKYQFWYEKDPSVPGRPVSAEKQYQLEQRYRNVLQAPKRVPIDGSRYHARMHVLVAALAKAMEARTEPEFVCANAVSKVGPWTDAFLMPGPDPLTPAATESYLAFEGELASCAPKLTLDYGLIGPDRLESNLAYGAIFQAGFDSEDFQTLTTLDALLTTATAASEKMDVAEKEMVEKLREGKIGLYTTEQEADEVSLDIVTKLGITPGEMLGSWLKFMRAYEDLGGKFPETETGELGSAKCKELVDSGFTEIDSDGKSVPVLMTLGALESRHHGECYRAYNLWRENNAHKYEVRGKFEPPAGPSWEELAAHAAELSGLGKQEEPPPAVTTPPEDIVPSGGPNGGGSSSGRSSRGDDEGEEESADDLLDAKDKAKSSGGCNAAPATNGASSGTLLLALALFAARKRRARRA